MATHYIDIPPTNFRVHSSLFAELKTVDGAGNLAKWVSAHDASAEEYVHFTAWMPSNRLSGGFTMKVRWRANATSGDCRWFGNFLFQTDQSLHTTSSTSISAVNTTTDATANDINETSLTLSTGAAASTLCTIALGRDATNGADTLAVDAEVLSVQMSYTSDTTISRGCMWAGAAAFAIPSGSGASIVGLIQVSAGSRPPLVKFPDSSGNFADVRFNVPSNYSGNLTVQAIMIVTPTSGAARVCKIRYEAATGAVASASDPSLTASSYYDLTATSGTTTPRIVYDSARSLPVTPAAGEEVVIRVRRDNTDSSTDDAYLIGLAIEYDIATNQPQVVRVDPASGTIPTSGGATLQTISDSNSAKNVATFADGSDLAADYILHVPGGYASGGTLRGRWRTSASSGNGYFRVDTASPASGAASDPSLSAGTAFTSASGGANLVNEWTTDISSGIAADDQLLIRVNRLGSNGSDTLSASVDLLELVWESNVVA